MSDLPINPSQVRYIKLGEAGRWEQSCLKTGIIRVGFGSAGPERFRLCREACWPAVIDSFLAEGKDRNTATRFCNELRLFFEDDGSTLWTTFIGERCWWGFAAPDPPVPHDDGEGVWRRVRNGWRSTDAYGEPLTKDRLSGALTKLAAYRGTSCRVDIADYVVRRINGVKTPQVERALRATEEGKASILGLMQLLTFRDFETLVDLVFSTSGWRRLGIVGGTQKTLDLDVTLPSTGERAMVQVKARTTSQELAEYVTKLDDHGPYDRLFFVFHTGEAATTDARVTVIGPTALADLILDAGLVTWLIRKAS